MRSQPEYTQRLSDEIEYFRGIENVHDLPPIFTVWAKKYVLPKITEVCGTPIAVMEEFYAQYISQYAAENPSEEIRITSIGAGNADLEVRVAVLLKRSGIHHFSFQCVDINPAMLERGRRAASKEQIAEHFEFLQTDVSGWQPKGSAGLVMAHHSLHHIEELESTFERIHAAIRPKGYFLACDMIGRNGHMRWPEALEIIQNIWRTMPKRYKYNHQLKRFEELYENWDCSTEGFEGIRAQDILPLLTQMFRFEAFAAFGNLPDIFVDRSFGHNFDPENTEDVEFIDHIAELNDRLISEGKLKPTQMVAVMRANDATTPCRHHLHWTPEFCIRIPAAIDSVNKAPFLPVPLSGCGAQQGAATGFWPDGWMAGSLSVTIRADQDVDSIVIDGYLPEKEPVHEPNLSVAVNGSVLLQERARAGLFSFHVPCRVSAGTLVKLKITADRTYCPISCGTGTDNRDLAIILRKIHVVPAQRSQS